MSKFDTPHTENLLRVKSKHHSVQKQAMLSILV